MVNLDALKSWLHKHRAALLDTGHDAAVAEFDAICVSVDVSEPPPKPPEQMA